MFRFVEDGVEMPPPFQWRWHVGCDPNPLRPPARFGQGGLKTSQRDRTVLCCFQAVVRHRAAGYDKTRLGLPRGGVVLPAIIMAFVFAGFIFSPETMIAQIGFTLAIGVLVGAFLVRMTLIPAAFAILGRATWWAPRWLLRILPDLDIEGHRLGRPESTVH